MMTVINHWRVAFCILFVGLCNIATATISPIGNWQTIDDETHKPRSIIKIWKKQGELFGKIEKIYFRKGEDANDVCKICRGPEHNKRVLGMTILWNLKGKGQFWTDGKILDPHNGKTYRCNITMSDNGKTLSVRGYIGLPLFGRSQTWHKVNS